MTVEDVRRDVAQIAADAGDPETAHSSEDALMVAVLKEIAAGSPDAAALAAEALKTAAIDFPRWCA